MYHEVEMPELRGMSVWAFEPEPKKDVGAVVIRVLLLASSAFISLGAIIAGVAWVIG